MKLFTISENTLKEYLLYIRKFECVHWCGSTL